VPGDARRYHAMARSQADAHAPAGLTPWQRFVNRIRPRTPVLGFHRSVTRALGWHPSAEAARAAALDWVRERVDRRELAANHVCLSSSMDLAELRHSSAFQALAASCAQAHVNLLTAPMGTAATATFGADSLSVGVATHVKPVL
jgi:hypothetical protein